MNLIPSHYLAHTCLSPALSPNWQRLRRVSSTAFLTALLSTTAHAEQASQVYMFGDSSSDSGTYYIDGTLSRPINEGNLWVETIAQRYGVALTAARRVDIDTVTPNMTVSAAGGANYAVSGATTLSWGDPPAIPFADQIAWFQEDHAAFEKNALVFVSFDANDPFSAILNGVSYDPAAYAAAYVNGIDELKSLGARNIVAMGDTLATLTPDAYSTSLVESLLIANGVPAVNAPALALAAVAQYKQDILDSRAALWPQLSNAGVYIIALNKVASDIEANPNAYGFYQGADATLSCSSCPSDGFVFTDDGHYSAAAQAIFADYTFAQLRARDQFVHVLTQPMAAMRAQMAKLEPRLDSSAFHENGADGQWHKRVVGNWVLQHDVDGGRSHTSSTGGSDVALRTDRSGGRVGGDVLLTDNFLIGVHLSYAQDMGGFGSKTGSFSRDTAAATAYSTLMLNEQAYLNLALAYGHLNYDKISRSADLGSSARASARGTTSGSSYAIRFGGGYDYAVADWTVTPQASLTAERVTLDGYEETAGTMSLAYGDSQYDSLRSAAGVNIALTGGSSAFRPYARLSVEHDLLKDDIKVDAGPTTDLLVAYRVDRPQRTVGRGEIGGRYQISDETELQLGLGIERSLSRSKDTNIAAHIGVKINY